MCNMFTKWKDTKLLLFFNFANRVIVIGLSVFGLRHVCGREEALCHPGRDDLGGAVPLHHPRVSGLLYPHQEQPAGELQCGMRLWSRDFPRINTSLNMHVMNAKCVE